MVVGDSFWMCDEWLLVGFLDKKMEGDLEKVQKGQKVGGLLNNVQVEKFGVCVILKGESICMCVLEDDYLWF